MTVTGDVAGASNWRPWAEADQWGCVLRVAYCVLRTACCVLRVAYCAARRNTQHVTRST